MTKRGMSDEPRPSPLMSYTAWRERNDEMLVTIDLRQIESVERRETEDVYGRRETYSRVQMKTGRLFELKEDPVRVVQNWEDVCEHVT